MTEWRTVERPSTLSVQPRAQVVGDIPDAHVITVRERRVTVDYPTIIQNNVNTDVIELDLDGEWDDMSVVLVLGPCGGATELAWHGVPVTLPSALAEDTGGIDVSVVGYSADGETRLVTVAAPSLLDVIKSGCTVGEAPAEETPDLIGQLVAAGDAANKAAQAANAAATAANGAAGTANAAASAANTAAGKAGTAADDARGAAGVASDAAIDADRAAQSANAAAEAASAAAEAARGNVLKGTLGPAPLLSADDAYATKPRKLTVQGKTRKNLWVNPSGTANGVTATDNDDGSFTVSGTSTGVAIIQSRTYILKSGSKYTVSVDKPMSTVNAFWFDFRDADDTQLQYTQFGNNGSNTEVAFTAPSDTAYVYMSVAIPPGQTVSGTYRVMLNEGSTAKPWCPPGLNSVGELSIVTAGKNLFSTMATATIGGITLEKQEDGGYHIYGTSTQQVQFITEQYVEFPEGSYTISGGKASKVMAWTYKADKSYIGPMVSDNGKSVTFDVSRDNRSLVTLLIQVEKSTSVDEIIYPQFELGSTATAYEPPTVTTTPIDLDGNTLCSLPDGTHDELTIDATGAVTLTKRTWSDVFDGTENWQDSTNRYGLDNGITFGATPDRVIRDKQMADTLPATDAVGGVNGIRAHASKWVDANIASMQGDLAGFKAWLGNNNTTLIYKLAEPQTIPLPPVTLPTLPAPTVNVWADAESSGTGYAMGPDAEMEYERDVTIAFNKLQAQISATTVREATNG